MRTSSVVLTWVVLAFLATLSVSSAASDLFPGRQYALGSAYGTGVAVGDFNQDGRQDVAATVAANDSIMVFMGNGDGTLADGWRYPVGDRPTAIATGDFLQTDGIADLVVANFFDNDLTIMLGNGAGGFTPATEEIRAAQVRSIAVGDVNGDGRADIVTIGDASYGPVSVLTARPDGSGFDRDGLQVGEKTTSVTLHDLDQDGLLDIVAASPAKGATTLFLHYSDGSFGWGGDVPAGGAPYGVAVGDLDQDGQLDIVTANRDAGAVSVSFGTGNAYFSAPTLYSAGEKPRWVEVSDMDLDGHPDIVVAHEDSGTFLVLWNLGDGTFTDGRIEVAGGDLGAFALGDLNGDGWPDPLFSSFECRLSVALGRGSRDFDLGANYTVTNPPLALAVGDFNEDDREDLAVAASGGGQVLLGTGDGTFDRGADVGSVASDMVVGDFNEDGHQDLYQVNAGTTAILQPGKGDGTFDLPIYITVPRYSSRVVTGDLNMDDHLDVVVSMPAADSVMVMLGDGNAGFSAPDVFFGGGYVQGLALGDYNQDGCLDLVSANRFANNLRFFKGTCDGRLIGSSRKPVGAYPEAIASGDFNEDGILDLVNSDSGEEGRLTAAVVRILLGHGNGTFADPVAYLTQAWIDTIQVIDLNGDGHLDLTMSGASLFTMLGNGDGTFSPPMAYSAPGAASAVVGDFNRDGLPDAAVRNYLARNVTVYLQENDPPEPPVEIDIKPGDSPNSVNPRSRGLIPVAVLGTQEFEVIDVNVSTLRFGPGSATIAHRQPHYDDVNDDGHTDLITHYRTQETGVACGDTSLTLAGELLDGRAFESSDSIQTVGCRITRNPAAWMKDQDTGRRDGLVDIKRE